MRIIATGIIAFVIWSFVSAWLFNDKIKPAMNDRVAEQPAIQVTKAPSDSLSLIRSSMPENLPVFFEFNKSEFKADPTNESHIAEFKSFIEKNPSSVLSVKGYTDLVGTPEFNLDLGLKRALKVQKYFVEKGFPAERMKAESGGEDISSGNYITEEGRAKARRAEISVKM
jgi:outer membrane protein OmpA-like peptidoglycan-associated protein